MNDDQQIRESILARLKRCGVPVSNLQLSVGQNQVEVTGSVDTFYSLQLIQSQLRAAVGARRLIQKVFVPQASEQTSRSRWGVVVRTSPVWMREKLFSSQAYASLEIPSYEEPRRAPCA